ncbi:MAG: PEP/pyruvate-binding domain-containing protein [Polyangiales bacterium]
MPRSLHPLRTLSPRRAGEFGSKAVGLATLIREGLPVPQGFALSSRAATDFYHLALAPPELPSALRAGGPLNEDQLSAIRQKLTSFPIPAMLRDQLRDVLTLLLEDGTQAIAVRSSSTVEDRDAVSGAGLHSTFLGVRTEEELHDALRHVWASLFRDRVFGYHRPAGAETPRIGVVLQRLIPADVSGVLFTANPLTGDAGELVIDASFGLGRLVVDGRVSPDSIRMDKASRGPRDRIVGTKHIRLDFVNGVTEESSVAPELASELALTSPQVDALTRLGMRIEDLVGKPQDVEWALCDGEFFVLQARPITTALQPGTQRWRKRDVSRTPRDSIVWSNVNVGEALPGVATPLTWSILSGFSELGFRRAFGALGCAVPPDAELVGNFRGRIFLNLTEFMSILTQVPGLRPKRLLALGGGGGVQELEASIRPRSPARFLARIPWTLTRFARENRSLSERVEAFEATLRIERKRMRRVDPRVLTGTSLSRTINDVARLLDESGAIMLTAYGNLLGSVVLLNAALRLFTRDDAPRLAQELLTGLSDLDSAAPGIALWHIAALAADEPAAAEVIRSGEAGLTVSSLPHGATRRALSTFLEAYGHRGPREAELREPRWREDPAVLFATLRLHLSQSGPTPVERERKMRARREAAEEELRGRTPVPVVPMLRKLLSLARRFMRLRERLRGYVTEVLGEYRRIALDASRRIHVREPDAGEDAAFFLTESELQDVLSSDMSVATRVRQRRRQYERDRALPDPPHTFVGYPPPTSAAPQSKTTDTLIGLPASPGRIRGRARVITDNAELRDVAVGEILVTPCADVGLAPLFLTAAGVVTDLGGPLSHASIVLREYGVPAVVNAAGATARIKSGDLIEIDGELGHVRILP